MRLTLPGFRTWLLLLLLILGGGLALLDSRETDAPGPVPQDAAGEPDYYLEDVEATRFDTEGRPHQHLVTPRLVHTPIDDVTRLERPVVRLRDDDGRRWFARAEQGRLETGGNPLVLNDDVRLEAPEERWHLTTRTLHYDADTGHAWSETPATFSQPPQSMRGDQFDAWIHDNRARLTDNVRGHHPPATDEDPEP